MDRHIWVADTETTGATPEDKICEIAYVEVDGDLNEVRTESSLIDPQRHISASASGVHGITDDMVAEAPTIEEFFDIVHQPPVTGDVVLIAHRVQFDRARLEPALNRVGVKVVGQLCTLRLARRYLPQAEDHKLTTLSFQYGLERGTAHRALADVRTCLSLLRFLVRLSGKSLNQMIDEDHIPVLVPVMPFGKHKGVPMAELDKSYAAWALSPRGMTDIDPDLRYTLQLRAEGKI